MVKEQNIERSEKVKEEFKRLKSEGYLCGTAGLIALAKAYGIPLCHELECQSILFTRGGGVFDRCAIFQSAAVLIGLRFGRISPLEERKRYREAMKILSDAFSSETGGYLCRQFPECAENDDITKRLLETAVEALEKISEKF